MLFTIVVGVVVLGLMVLAHEVGHFIVAKLFGVRVDTFSIGFGPRLFGHQRGPTDYRVSALPLGGYVKMAGDTPGEERAGAPDEFLSKPRWQRALVVLGGPTMNVLLAVLLLAGLYAYRYERPAFYGEPAVVGAIVADSPAVSAGIQPGDRIVELAGAKNPTWREVLVQAAIYAGRPVQVALERGGEVIQVEVTPSSGRRAGFVGWVPYDSPVVLAVAPDTPAARAGLQPGDVLLELDGERLTPSPEEPNVVSDRVQKRAGAPISLSIERAGQRHEVVVQPEFNAGEQRWMLGVQVGPRVIVARLSPWEAVEYSVAQNWQTSGWILTLVGRLFTGRASMRALEGPVGIVRHSGEAARLGGGAVVNLMVVISLSLGLLNLLPIPVLDGGHLLLLGLEGALRRDLSVKVKERMIQAGFVFLMLIFAIVMYNDIARLFGS